MPGFFDHVSASAESDQCPVTGLPVHTKPEWTNVFLGGNHRVSLKVVGDRIIVSHPTGYNRRGDLEPALDLIEHIAETAIPSGEPFVWVADYSELEGSSLRGRRYYAERTAQWHRLHTLVFCGMPTSLKAAAKLGKRLGLAHYNVLFADEYDEALRLAEQTVARIRAQSASSGQRQTIELDGCSLSLEVLEETILHGIARGLVEARHIGPIFDFQEQFFRNTDLAQGSYSILVDVRQVERVLSGARLAYVRAIRSWYERWPFEIEILYGANTPTRAAANLTRPFVKFPTAVVKTREAGLEIIRSRARGGRSKLERIRSALGLQRGSDGVGRYVDELMQALGSVNWEIRENRQPLEIDPQHPFAPVFEAIELLATELEYSLEARLQAEEENRQLQEKFERARKMEALGLLAGGVAHDLNNVLSGIVTYPDFLLMNQDLDDKVKEGLMSIKSSGQQAAAIVADLVTIARGVAVNTKALRVEDMIVEYLSSPSAERLGRAYPKVTVETRLAAEPVAIKGSAVHLKKLVMNLFTNALEAIGEDATGTITIATSFVYLDQPITGFDEVKEGEYCVLTIADDGPGIDPEELERIFEPFYTRKVMGRSGTGLGLTVVWNTVQDHGGAINVESSGDGTRFEIFFPVTAERIEDIVARTPLANIMGSGEKILIVDDSPTQREIASRLLESLGYEVAAVASGETAVEFLERESADLILLDMIMEPGIGGRETYRRIAEFRPGQRAVIASGYTGNQDVRRVQELGAGPFVAKPYTLETLGTAIRSELKR